MAYRISQLAKLVGLSRTALLYYEKQGLIQGNRQSNGYRLYTDQHLQRIRLVQQLLAGGLTLKECKACLDAKIDHTLLESRLRALDEEIAQKQASRQLLAALLGKGDLSQWHIDTDKLAPDAHLNWLKQQGFSEKEALRLKWLSKNMNEHEHYMADFMRVFEPLDRWGPGSQEQTQYALKQLPFVPQSILEIGCGKGLSTKVLAASTSALVTAVDNEPAALEQLNANMAKLGYQDRVKTLCASMTDLPLDGQSFDLIWAEGCAYIMGVTQALTQWQSLLSDKGVLMLSDAVWLTESPDPQAYQFWNKEYPDMQTVGTRLQQIKTLGYQVHTHFTIAEQAWHNYYQPLEARVNALATEMPDSKALADIRNELSVYHNCLGQFGYQMFILTR